jgi:hypothetical protein
VPDETLAVGAILEIELEMRHRGGFHLAPIPDESLALQHFRQATLHLRTGDLDGRAFDAHRIADAGEHVGDGIGHHVCRTLL